MLNLTLTTLEQCVSYSLLTINIFSIVFYVLVLVSIRRRSSFFGNIYLQFIIAVAFQDLIILATIIPLYFIDTDSMSIYLLYTISVLFYLCVISELLLHAVVAFNRFMAIVFVQKYKLIFNLRFSRLSILLCFLVAVLFLVYEIFYQNQSAVITFAINAVCWFLTIILYGVAGVLSVKRAQRSLTRRQRTDFRRELKLFKQALIITVVTSIFLILQFFPNCSRFACKMCAYAAILAYGIAAPASYLVIDKTLRAYVMKTLFCRKENTVAAALSTIAVPKQRNEKTTLA